MIYYFSARNPNVCRILQNERPYTHEYHHSMWGKHLISLVEITENSCYCPPSPTESGRLPENTEKLCYCTPPLNRVGFWRSRKRLKKFNKLNLAALLQMCMLANDNSLGNIPSRPSVTYCSIETGYLKCNVP